MEFTNNKMDFVYDPNFGGLKMFENEMISFTFPDFLQSENFILQSVNVDSFTGEVFFSNELTLDNSKKHTNYFENYTITPLGKKLYRIKAGEYFTKSLIEIIDTINFSFVEKSTSEAGILMEDETGNAEQKLT